MFRKFTNSTSMKRVFTNEDISTNEYWCYYTAYDIIPSLTLEFIKKNQFGDSEIVHKCTVAKLSTIMDISSCLTDDPHRRYTPIDDKIKPFALKFIGQYHPY